MTNANSSHKTTDNFSHPTEKISDEAPMVVTRLSGWIGSADVNAPAPAWIIPTRVRASN